MKSVSRGIGISVPEVTNLSSDGFCVQLKEESLYLPFAKFPWFRQASSDAIVQVLWLSQNHLYWPQLDIDLAVDSIRDPEQYPLMARVDV
ncbi:MAG: DUF2442 domain-containing protein [Gammaproteobacteria bacterium]